MDFGELFGISSDDADFETPATKETSVPKKTVEEPKKTSYTEIMRSSGSVQSKDDGEDEDEDEDGDERNEDNDEEDEEEEDDDQSHLLEEMVEELESKEKKKQSKKCLSQLPVFLLLSRLLTL